MMHQDGQLDYMESSIYLEHCCRGQTAGDAAGECLQKVVMPQLAWLDHTWPTASLAVQTIPGPQLAWLY